MLSVSEAGCTKSQEPAALGGTGTAVPSYRGVLVSAAVVGLVAGQLWQGVTVAPDWAALGWLALTAVGSQVCGWLLVALASFRLSSTVSSALLLLTPAGALVLAALVLNEQPSALQLTGCVLMLAGIYALSISSWRRHTAAITQWRRNLCNTDVR